MRAGAVLAVLDTRTLALQADQARAQMDAQQQTLLRLRNGSRPEEIAQARSRLVAAQADAARPAGPGGCAASPPTRKGAASAPRTWTAPAAPRRWPWPRRTNSAKRCAWPRQARKEDIAGAEAQLQATQAQLALLRHQISQAN